MLRTGLFGLARSGGANLFTASGGRQPLLEALRYPDRHVQYEAALTLGEALPRQRFPGDVRVVPLLASAVRTGDESFAVVIADSEEDRRVHATRLENLGFTIVAAGEGLAVVRPEVAQAVGVDLVVLQVASAQEAVDTVGELHVEPQTAAAPILVVAPAVDLARLKREFRDEIRVKVARARVDADAYGASVDEVMLRAAGGRMTEAEAEALMENLAVSDRALHQEGELKERWSFWWSDLNSKVQQLRAVLRDGPNPKSAVAAVFQRAFDAFLRENHVEALGLLARCLEMDPLHEQAWQYRTLSFSALGLMDQARAASQSTLEINPHNRVIRKWVEGNED